MNGYMLYAYDHIMRYYRVLHSKPEFMEVFKTHKYGQSCNVSYFMIPNAMGDWNCD